MAGRRGLAAAVVGIAVGAGLVLLAASRVWSTELVPRPSPLSAQEVTHTGASLVPALPALGLVALAGAGGLLATRGRARALVGALLCAAAVGVFVLVVRVLAGGAVGAGWPVAGGFGAALVATAGVLAVRVGPGWPVMGSRYGRAGRSAPPGAATPPARPDAPAGKQERSTELWDALERGEDPTRD